MFLEPRTHKFKRGWIEVICGSMFSGKTEELIRRLKRAQFANLSVEIFKPEFDTRYNEEKIVSHDNNEVHSTAVPSSQNILLLTGNNDVVGIDEAQFFDDGIVNVCEQLAADGKRIIVAGLDMDYLGNPFGPIPKLLAVAEYVTKLHAICMECGSLANHSFRKVEDHEQFFLGEKSTYEPLCRHCYSIKMKKKNDTKISSDKD